MFLVQFVSLKMISSFSKLDNKFYFCVKRKVQISYVLLYILLSSFDVIAKGSQPTTGRFRCDESQICMSCKVCIKAYPEIILVILNRSSVKQSCCFVM